jgi:hydroxymethylpyrimidine/phosphomethylpyrimidine kinase
MSNTAPVPAVLVVGGLDSSGGAGVLRDVQAIAGSGGEARVVLTAVTAQSDRAVLAQQPLPVAMLRAQIDAAQQQGPLGAVKLGMLGTAATVRELLRSLPRQLPWVLDPVLAASSGAALLDRQGIRLLLDDMLPAAALLTPNLPELATLAAHCGAVGDDQSAQLDALLARTPAVLLKGGHAPAASAVVDRLCQRGQPPRQFVAARQSFALRGSGCTLASLVAAALARGQGLEQAVATAHAGVAAWFQSHAQVRAGPGRRKPAWSG